MVVESYHPEQYALDDPGGVYCVFSDKNNNIHRRGFPVMVIELKDRKKQSQKQPEDTYHVNWEQMDKWAHISGVSGLQIFANQKKGRIPVTVGYL